MHFLKFAVTAMAVLSLAGLSACGGGGEGGGSTPPPDASAQGGPVQAGTLTLVPGSSVSFAPGSYPLDTSYAGASGTAQITGHTLEWVYPENAAFMSGFFFAQTDASKFLMGMLDPLDSDTEYQCVSSAWTPSELAELAVLFDEPDLANVAKCPAGITVDAVNRHIWFNNVRLTSSAPGKALTFSVNLSWALQPNNHAGGGEGETVSNGSIVQAAQP